MSIFEPEAIDSLAATKIAILSTAADMEAVSLATEIGAVSTIDVTLTFFEWNPTVTPNTGNRRRRVGTRNQFPIEGQAQFAPIQVSYPHDPQADDADPNNKCRATLVEGTVKYVLVREGADSETAFAATDAYEIRKVRCGRQNRGKTTEDEFGEYQITQMLYPLSEEVYGVVAA